MMENLHLEFLVEEPSMEAFLNVLLPRLFPDCTFRVHAFQGKTDMLDKLQNCNRSHSFVKFRDALIEAMT